MNQAKWNTSSANRAGLIVLGSSVCLGRQPRRSQDKLSRLFSRLRRIVRPVRTEEELHQAECLYRAQCRRPAFSSNDRGMVRG